MPEADLPVCPPENAARHNIGRRELARMLAAAAAATSLRMEQAKASGASTSTRRVYAPDPARRVMQGEASTASLRSPTGLTNSSRPSAFWSGIGEYLSVERAVTTASDLISCGPLAYTAVVAGLPEGWGEGLGAMVLAKCLPQLMGDVALPNAVNAALHSGMDLLLPSGTVAGLAVSLGFDSKYTFVAAGVGSAVSDLREMIENAANLSKIDTQELIEGFDWLGKQMDFMDEAERILNERSETEHSQDGGRSDEFEQPERIDAQGAGPNLPISQPAPEKPGADIGLD